MKVLLDERVPAKFAKYLTPHDCVTVPAAGLAGMKNGEVLSRAEQMGFELFLTVDQGIAHQQSLSDRALAVIVLRPASNRLADLLALREDCLTRMADMVPGQLVVIPS